MPSEQSERLRVGIRRRLDLPAHPTYRVCRPENRRNHHQQSQTTRDSASLPEKVEILKTKVATFQSIVGALNTEIEKCVLKLETSDRESRTNKEELTKMIHKQKNLERQAALTDFKIAKLNLHVQVGLYENHKYNFSFLYFSVNSHFYSNGSFEMVRWQ